MPSRADDMSPRRETPFVQGDSLLKLSDVMRITRMGKSTIYRKIKANEFPRAYDSGSGVRWKNSEIDAWMASLTHAKAA